MRHNLPYAATGQAIGLLGGSFDPPHGGHVRITREALKRFGLDRIWWLVTPGNPMKTIPPAPMRRRLAACRALMQHPKIEVTDLENRLKTRFTAETVHALRRLYPGVRFVWLMGADNLVQFHRWDHWCRIMENVPVGVLARPGDRLAACLSPAARAFRRHRLPASMARVIAGRDPPVWSFVDMPMSDASSTRLRRSGTWQR